jgi:hypothetical protein
METNEGLRRFAYFYSRHQLREEHYEGCKITYSLPHAYAFVFEFLQRGYSIIQIHRVYLEMLRKWHAIAVDGGKKELLPSGLISEARKELLKHKPASKLIDPKGILSRGKRKAQLGIKPFGSPKGHA